VIAQKQVYYTPKLDLEVGESIAVTAGYETYGRLSASRDNVILICHHFSGTSHAAGRYHRDDQSAGWWDGLIGPGKAFDTDQYFVICVDMLCNLNTKSPLVTTTGPVTVNPATGRPYGQSFPQVTIRDNVRLQRQLLKSLEIERLACVAGPSMGGFQALEWAVTFPHLVDRVIAAASCHATPPIFALAVCQAGIDAIMADSAFRDGNYYGEEGPLDGLTRATLILTTLARSDEWIDGKWRRKTAAGSPLPWADSQGRFAFQSEMEQIARERAQAYDANHYCYLARTSILHDIGHGTGGLEGAAERIQAKVLMLPINSDLFFPTEGNRRFVDAVQDAGGSADMILVESPNGHLAAIYECKRFAEPISRFLCRTGVH